MSYVVDYHMHSYYSDGTMSPVDLVKKYKDAEYDIISLTDHDGIDGLKEAAIAAEALKIKFVPGVELSTEHKFTGQKSADEKAKDFRENAPQNNDFRCSENTAELKVGIHLLGYDFDPENEALTEKLKEMKANRRERNEKLVEKLKEMGYELDLAELEKQSKDGYVKKPNIARVIAEKGYIEDYNEAFEEGKILESPEIKGIHKKKLSTEEAIDLVSNAGGMAVIAHPAKIRGMGERGSEVFWKNMETLIKELKKAGLKGVECYHPSHSEEESWRLFKIASKYHLHVTEGSDFHGEESERK